MDVEASTRQRGRNTPLENPYSDTVSPLHYWHPLNVMKRGVYIGISLYGLHHLKAYETIMRDPSVSHEWFKFAIAASVALLFVKGYVEIYAGKLKKQKVSYTSYPRSTHAAIFLILLSSLAYHIALWPAYGSKTMLVMFLSAMFLLNFCLLFPTYVQNLVAFIILGFFLQEYNMSIEDTIAYWRLPSGVLLWDSSKGHSGGLWCAGPFGSLVACIAFDSKDQYLISRKRDIKDLLVYQVTSE